MTSGNDEIVFIYFA